MQYNIYINKINNCLFIISLQLLPKNESEKKFYGRDPAFDKQIKNRINKSSLFYQENNRNSYFNGSVEVIIPIK